MKKPVSIQDFYRFKFPSFVRLSPDGKLASFTVTQMDEQANAYNSYLYVSGLEGNWVRQLSFGGKEKNAVWLDATTLLFSAPAKDAPKEKDDGAPLTVFYTIDVGGGEAQELFRVEQSVGSIAPLGPGRFLLSCNCPVEAAQKPEEGAPKAAVQGKDFEIFEELPFWFNARGVVNRKRNRLALYEQEGGTLTFLTGPWSNVQSFSLSPSKSLLAYSASTYEDVSPRGNARAYTASPTEPPASSSPPRARPTRTWPSWTRIPCSTPARALNGPAATPTTCSTASPRARNLGCCIRTRPSAIPSARIPAMAAAPP